jgi:hypothetical protein
MTPGKNQGTWSTILREQSYLKGIEPKHLRPWTVKKKGEPATNALPPTSLAPTRQETPPKPEIQ